MHDSNQSSVTNLTTGVISSTEVENASNIVDWSTLVIEPEIDENNDGDEKLVDEKAMFALFGLKTEADERDAEVKVAAMFAPILHYDAHEVKVVAMLVDDKAPEEPFLVWDERHPNMEIGTPYPDMVAFRKAIKQFAINGEFEFVAFLLALSWY